MFKTNRSTDYNKRQAIRSVGGELPSPFSTHDLRAFFFGAAAESRVYRFVIIKQACASTKPKMHLILNLRRIFVQKNKYASGIAGKLLPFHVFGNASLLTMSIIYGLLLLFIRFHAKKTEKPLQVAKEESGFEKNPRMDKALLYFACILGTGILLVLCSSFLPFLQAYTMIIVALMFLIGGLVAVSKSGMEKKKRWETFVSGVVSILPSILMILMASSIKYMMVEGKILDTMLHGAVQVASGLPKGGLIFVHLPNLPCNEFLHTLRFIQSVSADSSYCAACADIRSQNAALHCCIRLWRRFQQCVLPNQSRASYFAEPRRSQLRRMGKVFLKIPRAEPDIDKRYTAARLGVGILTE